ncbi:MAG: sigma-70 family RNA polymerase sigma factor [Pseudomonadota bacterium]
MQPIGSLGWRRVLEDDRDGTMPTVCHPRDGDLDSRKRAVRVEHSGATDEAAMVDAVANGDAGAFRALVDRHLPRVLARARRLLGDATEAEDVAQEALLRLWRTAGSLDVDHRGVGPWLGRVAANLAIDRLRSAKRLEVRDELPEMPVAAEQLVALTEHDVSDRVMEALSALPDRQRVALTLFHFDELSQREVAEILEVSEDALESLLARGRRKLRAILADEWQSLLETDAAMS